MFAYAWFKIHLVKRYKFFFKTTFDVFKIYWTIAPRLTSGILITRLVLNLQGLVNAYVFAAILDKLILFVNLGKVSVWELLPIVIVYSLSILIFSVTSSINGYFGTLLSSQDNYKLKLKHTDFLETLGMIQMENPELTNKSTRYMEVYSSFGQHLSSSVSVITNFISSIITGAVIFSFQPILVGLYLLLFVFKFANNSRFRNKIWTLFKDNTEERRTAWTSINVLTDPPSLKELLVTDATRFLRRKFTEFTGWYYLEYKRVRTRWEVYDIFQTVLDTVLFGFGMFLVVQKGISGAISIGAITFYIRSLGSFSDQIDNLSNQISRVMEEGIRIKDAIDLFEEYKPDTDGSNKLSDKKTPPQIKLDHVSFSYPNGVHPVIKDLNLFIKPGEKIAIVGENGAGKTTLVKLIARVYRASEGVITIDEKPLNSLRIKEWYKKLGILFQDFNIYGHLTVEENVIIGRISIKAKNEKIRKSLKKADAFSFVEEYPLKTKQKLSERFNGGIRPSGGQWQKIAIARFFYRNAPILILDEPTASIDAVSEAKIFDNVYKFMNGKTVIIISHRFSTVRNADRILVLDKGRIVEDGSHEELMKLGGKYAKAFKLQAKGYS